jgi:ornithine cyclodeaminase/alanine dehydrogenase-like protein (mu-crystallin family)
MLVLSNEDVERLLPMEAAIEALEPAYCDLARKEALSPARRDLLVRLAGEPLRVYEFKDMPSVFPRQKVAALRINSDVLSWPVRAGTMRREKVPTAAGNRWVGLLFLFDMDTGELIAIMPDGVMQRLRVGAANAIAAKHLARADASTVALLGSGWQAGAQLLGICAVRAVGRVLVFSPNAEHREVFAREWARRVGIPVEAVSRASEAVAQADWVVAATNSVHSVFQKEWLRPGMFLSSIRPFEFDRETLERCDIVVVHSRDSEPHSFLVRDDRNAVPELAEGGARPEGGVIDWGQQPELGELLAGKIPGRSTPEQITCFVNNIGLGLQFAACGAMVYQRAREQGAGHEVPSDWFTQDVHP